MTGLIRTPTAVLEIDLSAVQDNFRHMRRRVGPRCEVAAVVKSDAYGLGLAPISKVLAAVGCRAFFVANLTEAVELRAILPKAWIAVLCDDTIGSRADFARLGLIPVINSASQLLDVQVRPTSYVLNADTGFSRLGLGYDEIRSAYLTGGFHRTSPTLVMSHLACSDLPADETNIIQRDRFAAIRRLLPEVPASLAASAAVWLGKRYHLDMARIGSALYGLNNAHVSPNPLKPVVRLTTRILDVRTVPRGEVVGYAGAFRTTRPSRIAVAGLGYNQGLPWSCANRIAGRLGAFAAPVVGRISMEYITLDVTDVPEALCAPGSWVDILDADFGLDDLAAVLGVNGQEVLLRLGSRSARRYLAGAPEAPATKPRRSRLATPQRTRRDAVAEPRP